MSASAPEPAALRDAARHVVAVLVRQAGVAQLAAVEDAVQGALALGLERWPGEGPPRDLRAWLYRVAQRRLQDGRRKGARRR
ncbi:MAG: sigma factor, partial [Myxococcota bacterium]